MISSAEAHEHGLTLLYHSSHVVGIIPQSIVYGIYVTLISITSYAMYKNGLRSRSRKVLFGLIIVMFTTTTVYMVVSIVSLIQLIRVWFLAVDPLAESPPGYLPLFSALALSNYVLTDGVVLWRAWVLCKADSKTALIVCIFLLICASLSVITTIGIRIALMIVPSTNSTHSTLSRIIDVTQVANLVLSLLTNLLATTVVATKAWRYRKWFMSNARDVAGCKANVGRVLVLLIESGMFYCVSLITVLVSTVIPISVGTLGDLYTPVNFQFAGIYPIIVLLVVNQGQSLDKTAFVNSTSAPTSSTGGRSRSVGVGAGTTQSSLGSMIFRTQESRSFSIPQPQNPVYDLERQIESKSRVSLSMEPSDWKFKDVPDIPHPMSLDLVDGCDGEMKRQSLADL